MQYEYILISSFNFNSLSFSFTKIKDLIYFFRRGKLSYTSLSLDSLSKTFHFCSLEFYIRIDSRTINSGHQNKKFWSGYWSNQPTAGQAKHWRSRKSTVHLTHHSLWRWTLHWSRGTLHPTLSSQNEKILMTLVIPLLLNGKSHENFSFFCGPLPWQK